MSSLAPKDVKICYLFGFNSTYSSFMCNWPNDVNNHFVYMLENKKDFILKMKNRGHKKEGPVF
jgi:hypothetical protein